MAKLVEYDVTGVEESQGQTGVKARPGVKVAKIMFCERRDTKSDGSPANDIRVGMSVGEEFDWVWTYIGLGPESDWKLKEFIKALALKEKGKFDPDKMKGKLIRVKLNSDEYEGEYSPKVGKLFPAQPGDKDPGGVSVSSTTASGPDDDPEPAEDPDGDQASFEGVCREDPDDPEIGSYDEWPEEDLLAEVEARNLELPGGRGAKSAKAIKTLRADDEEATAAPEPEAEAEAATDDYDEWSLEDLQTEWEERQLGDLPAIRGRNREERLKTAIIEEIRKDDADNPFEG